MNPLDGARSLTRLRYLLPLFALLVALVAAELGLRAWLALRGKPYSAWATKQRLEAAADPRNQPVPEGATDPGRGVVVPLLHPYFGAEDEHDHGGVLRYFREEYQEGDWIVVVVGGSVASHFGATLASELPHRLQETAARVGRSVRVLNYAHHSYKEPQQLNALNWLLALGYVPDVVLNLDGFNGLALALTNAQVGWHPLYPSGPVWGLGAMPSRLASDARLADIGEAYTLRSRARALSASADRWSLWNSALVGRFLLGRVRALELRLIELQGRIVAVDGPTDPALARQLGGPDFTRGDGQVLTLCVEAWGTCSELLAASCATRGVAYLHALQPTLFDEGSKPLTPAEQAIEPPSPGWLVGPRRGYPLLRERGRLLRERGVRFLDLSQAFAEVEQTLYYDSCHFVEAGIEILVERLGPELKRLLAEAAPPRANPGAPEGSNSGAPEGAPLRAGTPPDPSASEASTPR